MIDAKKEIDDAKNAVTADNARSAMKFSFDDKSILVAFLLWFFIGCLGAHRMYLGKMVTGIIMAVLFIVGWATFIFFIGGPILGLVGLWWLVDAVLMILAARNQTEVLDSVIK